MTNGTKLILVLALCLSLSANVFGMAMNGANGAKTCRDLEDLKRPQRLEAEESLRLIKTYTQEYKNIFGSTLVVDPNSEKMIPRWQLEINRQIRRAVEKIDRYKERECKFLFWDV